MAIIPWVGAIHTGNTHGHH